MMTVHDILDRARASGHRLPAIEAGLLFSAAVRLAAAQGATLRSRLVQVDDQGGLRLLPFDDQLPELEMGYLAPELLAADAPRKSEPRVQVYAAGVLGYEILTGSDARNGFDAELPAPLGDIVRMALSPDRRERFGDLTQLHDAVESAQPRLPAEQERHAVASLLTRSGSGAAIEKEALAKLIAQFGAVQGQLTRLTAAQREMSERVDRFEDGQRLGPSANRRAPVLVPLLAGLLGAAAAIAGAWALGFAPARPAEKSARPESEPTARAAAPAAESTSPASVAAQAPDAGAAPQESSAAGAVAPTPAGGAAPAAAVAGPANPRSQNAGAAAAVNPAAEPVRGTGAAGKADEPVAPQDAGPAPLAATERAAPDAAPDAGSPDHAPAIRRPARASEVSPAMMAHAVAQAQVKRGESALEQSRIDDAIASFHTALENEPANAAALRGLGTAYSMQSNESMAIQSYEQYLRLLPGARDAAEIRRVVDGLKARAKLGGGDEK